MHIDERKAKKLQEAEENYAHDPEFLEVVKKIIIYGDSESLRHRAGWRESYYEGKDKKERDWQKSNICPKCMVVKAKNGKCSMGCDD